MCGVCFYLVCLVCYFFDCVGDEVLLWLSRLISDYGSCARCGKRFIWGAVIGVGVVREFVMEMMMF